MCMLYVKEPNVVLPKPFWDAINASNREGLGLYNITKSELIKTQNYQEGWDYINQHKADKMVVHHRLATSGPKTLEQLHGWDMENGYIFFHNGVMRTYNGTKTMSDTQEFVEEWKGVPLKPMLKYLEETESSSRFLLVHKETGEIVVPDCAKWNPVFIHEIGQTVNFSNDYAMSYHMLPPAYSRWGGYDDDWGSTYSIPKKTRTTRAGMKTTKRVESVFDKTLSTIKGKTVELKGGLTYDSKKEMHVHAESGLEFITYPKIGTGGPIYQLPDIARITGTDKFVFGVDLLEAAANPTRAVPFIDSSYAELILMNDVMTCDSADIAKAFIRLARQRLASKQEVGKSASLHKYIRAYELRIGYREGSELSLVQFLMMACKAEQTANKQIFTDVDEMTVAAALVEALAEELTKSAGFKYFKALARRVHGEFLIELKEQAVSKLKSKVKSPQTGGLYTGKNLGY